MLRMTEKNGVTDQDEPTPLLNGTKPEVEDSADYVFSFILNLFLISQFHVLLSIAKFTS